MVSVAVLTSIGVELCTEAMTGYLEHETHRFRIRYAEHAMQINKVVDNIGTLTDLKRVSSAYVIDYKALSEEEIREALNKTAPQYYHLPNVRAALARVLHCDCRDTRILSSLILKSVLLNKDDFACLERDTEDEVTAWEQSIIDCSNEEIVRKNSERRHSLELFEFLVDTAWQNNDDISRDENNLIEKVRNRIRITEREHRIIEAKLGKFPTIGNRLHTRSEIEGVRRRLQSEGLLFALRDSSGDDFDVIPEEIAAPMRKVFGLEMRDYGYRELLDTKYVRSKSYLSDLLKRGDIIVEKNAGLDELKQQAIDHLKPSEVLGGFSPKDGLSTTDLRKCCGDLGVAVSGSKSELVDRIVEAFDALRQLASTATDERAIFYEYFNDLAHRRSEVLRAQQLVQKDIEIERQFENATSYLFSTRLGHKPLSMLGTAHADGALSYQDKLILWDNKSKETPVNLADHIKQFDGYIKSADKPVAGFFVIGPSYSEDSSVVAMQYQVQNGVPICLITAEELKTVAEDWASKKSDSEDTKFPLGYLIQTGRFNPALLAGI